MAFYLDKIKQIHIKYIFLLIFFGVIFYIHILLLDVIPLYIDELAYAKRLMENKWGDFDSYKFYRLFGIVINSAVYWVFQSSPIVLSIVILLLSFFLIILFSLTFKFYFASKNSQIDVFFYLVFFSIPFTLYIVLIRVYSQAIAIFLILLSLWFICLLSRHGKYMLLSFILLFLYAISLLIYEITLLMPILFIMILTSIPKTNLKSKHLIFISGMFFIIFLLYLFLQFYFYNYQPKLRTPVRTYDQYRFTLTIGEQLLRKCLYFIYNIKWVIFYIQENLWKFKASGIIALILLFVFSGFTLWNLLSNRLTYLDRKKSILAIKTGGVFFCCSFGLWSYYWFFYSIIVTPPFYNVFLPAIGLTFVILGLLSVLSKFIMTNKAVKITIFLCLYIWLVFNILLFFAYRLAISNSISEAQVYAKQINNAFAHKSKRYKNITITGLPYESNYARYRINFSGCLSYYLNKENQNWQNITIGYMDVASLQENRINFNDSICLEYKNGFFEEIKQDNFKINRIVNRKPDDPFAVSFLNYSLKLSNEKQNMILEKQ